MHNHLTPFNFVQAFISDFLLEKLKRFANHVLRQQRKRLTTAGNILRLVIFHLLWTSRDGSPTTICSEAERSNFFPVCIAADRYHEVYAAFSGCRDRRNTQDYSGTGCCRSFNQMTALITEVEAETAAINRYLL